MRVLLAHERYLPDSGGGGEVLAHRRALHLRARGIEVQVICAGDPALGDHEGVPTRRLPLRRRALPFGLPAFIEAARSADLVHAFTYHAMLPAFVAARLTGRPLVCEYMALFGRAWSVMRSEPVALGYRAVERLLVALPAQGRIFLSEDSLALARGKPGDRVVLAPPGVDPAFFEEASPEPKGDFVLFAGKFEARKGVAELLAVARACPHIRFVAVGWGGDIAALRAAAPENLTVHESRGDRYRRLLRQARIFFFPSHAETFGIVVAEAMASGCAVIGTTGQGAEGVRVEAGDAAGMVAAVQRLWDDRDLCLALGARNRERARAYDWERSGDVVLGLYRTLLAHRLPYPEAPR
ncbi:glycosyltransferase family 4 protein [Methylobacterium sp. WSM2598]|uniref:glycosyltransferase family 4 protein n=1 Tax=Methylobacterium sp. WSM2598 TaxID=398261 RepID=UPI0003743D9B|nr:glycosyltransferase family 4 protein [Methylobacterium sp. WSM2598]